MNVSEISRRKKRHTKKEKKMRQKQEPVKEAYNLKTQKADQL